MWHARGVSVGRAASCDHVVVVVSGSHWTVRESQSCLIDLWEAVVWSKIVVAFKNYVLAVGGRFLSTSSLNSCVTGTAKGLPPSRKIADRTVPYS